MALASGGKDTIVWLSKEQRRDGRWVFKIQIDEQRWNIAQDCYTDYKLLLPEISVVTETEPMIEGRDFT